MLNLDKGGYMKKLILFSLLCSFIYANDIACNENEMALGKYPKRINKELIAINAQCRNNIKVFSFLVENSYDDKDLIRPSVIEYIKNNTDDFCKESLYLNIPVYLRFYNKFYNNQSFVFAASGDKCSTRVIKK